MQLIAHSSAQIARQLGPVEAVIVQFAITV